MTRRTWIAALVVSVVIVVVVWAVTRHADSRSSPVVNHAPVTSDAEEVKMLAGATRAEHSPASDSKSAPHHEKRDEVLAAQLRASRDYYAFAQGILGAANEGDRSAQYYLYDALR